MCHSSLKTLTPFQTQNPIFNNLLHTKLKKSCPYFRPHKLTVCFTFDTPQKPSPYSNQLGKAYTPFQTKLSENHTLKGGKHPYGHLRAVIPSVLPLPQRYH